MTPKPKRLTAADLRRVREVGEWSLYGRFVAPRKDDTHEAAASAARILNWLVVHPEVVMERPACGVKRTHVHVCLAEKKPKLPKRERRER